MSNAYLQTPIDSKNPIYVRFPQGHERKDTHVMRLKKALYGLKDSGYLFQQYLHSILVKLGYVKFMDSVYIKRAKDGSILFVVLTYVDDITILAFAGQMNIAIQEIRSHLICSEPETLSRLIGVNYEIYKDFIMVHQRDYAQALPCHRNMACDIPLPRNIVNEDDNSALITEPPDIKSFRSQLGQLSYLANTSRPDVSYAASYLSKFLQQPTNKSARLLDMACNYAKASADTHIKLKPSSSQIIHLTAYVDASLGSHNSIYSQTGYLVLHKNNPIAWKSHKQSRVSRSSCKAELNALDESVDYLIYIKGLLLQFFPAVTIELKTDAKDIIDLLKQVTVKPAEKTLIQKIIRLQDKTVVIPLHQLSEQLSDEKIVVSKVHTTANLADALTKPMDTSSIRNLLNPNVTFNLNGDIKATSSQAELKPIPGSDLLPRNPKDSKPIPGSVLRPHETKNSKLTSGYDLRPRHLLNPPSKLNL